MGMSSDYVEAIKNSSTFLRIGSSIFAEVLAYFILVFLSINWDN